MWGRNVPSNAGGCSWPVWMHEFHCCMVYGRKINARWALAKGLCRHLLSDVIPCYGATSKKDGSKYEDSRCPRAGSYNCQNPNNLIQLPSSGPTYLSVDSEWFENCISMELGEFHDCYLAKLKKDSTVSLLATTIIELACE